MNFKSFILLENHFLRTEILFLSQLLAAEAHDNKEREEQFLSSVRDGQLEDVQELVSTTPDIYNLFHVQVPCFLKIFTFFSVLACAMYQFCSIQSNIFK